MTQFDPTRPQISPIAGLDAGGEFHEPPGWPKVVGIISIVWASIGLLCNTCGLASFAMMGTFMKTAEQQLGPMPDVMKPTAMQMAAAAAGYIPIVILMIAGIATVGRKASGRSMHLTYVGVGLLLGVIGMGISVMHQLDVMSWAKQNAGDKWAQQAQSPFAWIGLAFGAVLSFAWPVFCGIWFGAMGRRPELNAPSAPVA